MLINDKEALTRLNSPLNLMNKLKSANGRKSAMSLFGIGNNKENGSITSSAAIPPENPFSHLIKENKPEPETKSLVPSVRTAEQNKNDSIEAREPRTENLIDNADNQIKLATAHNNALEVLNSALDEMKIQMTSIKPDKLPSVISAASKVVEGIRKERNEASKVNKDNRSVHLHFYTPAQRKLEEYEVIEA